MRIRLRVDEADLRGWHLELIAALGRRPDCHVDVALQSGPTGRLANVERLFGLERLIHRGALAGPAGPIPPSGEIAGYRAGSETADLVIDLCGAPAATDERVWRLCFDGVAGEAALLPALLQGRTPVAELREGEQVIAAGRPGTEAKGNLLETFKDALARITTLILAALDGALTDVPMPEAAPPAQTSSSLTSVDLGRRAGKLVARAAIRRIYRLTHRTPHWRTGWRRLDGPDLFDLRRHPDSGWTDLPDDGTRFYADPFPMEHDGQTVLFVEDFPHSTGKGIISAVPFGPAGPLGRPEPVLDLPYHLSYPFVFRRDGDMWMVPESGAAGTIDLFRATNYPHGWVKAATLVSGVTAGDATLIEHGGRWWMFATVKSGGSYSDALHLWSAPDFRGPWTAHRRNPVLIDSASARPAGRIVFRNGTLWRPVQDCRAGYGAALGIARILRLDDDVFAQRVETILTAGPLWPGRWLHTVNSAGGFEFIDGSGRALRRPRI